MQYAVLAAMLLWVWRKRRQIRRLRMGGLRRKAERCYRTASVHLGLLMAGAMLAQEAILWRCGMLTAASGLPLHLCSMMGVLTLPMLLTRSRLLWHASVYAGVPGALLALVFPAVLETPWPHLTSTMFHILHAGIAVSPLLPAAMGLRLQPGGALTTWLLLLTAALLAGWVNGMTGGNYLFLAGPVDGTPLMLMASQGLTVYRLLLITAASGLLLAEGIAVYAAGAIRQKTGNHPQ